MTKIRNGDKAAFRYQNFDKEVNQFTARVKPGSHGGSLNIHVDQPWGKKPAIGNIPGSEENKWVDLGCAIENAEGIQVLWLNFNGKSDDIFELDWIKIEWFQSCLMTKTGS